jgi:hypothetical protein
MNVKTVALHFAMAALLSSSLLSFPAEAIEPEKQPIYSNTPGGLLCGTQSQRLPQPPQPASPCTVPAGQRLIIEHVSGYSFQDAVSGSTTMAISLVVTDTALGLNGGAFHTFVATKTNTSGGTDVFSFSTPFKMMLHPGATFYFSPTDADAVSGYLVKE